MDLLISKHPDLRQEEVKNYIISRPCLFTGKVAGISCQPEFSLILGLGWALFPSGRSLTIRDNWVGLEKSETCSRQLKLLD